MKTIWPPALVFALALTLATFDPLVGRAHAVPDVSFAHGVASGDVTAFSAVLWTRVDRDTPLKIEVALSPDLRDPHFKEEVRAQAANDFTVKVVASPLLPDRFYYYRWRHGSAMSPVGTFKTAPPPDLSASARFT
jgi:alkaline phosphatase D